MPMQRELSGHSSTVWSITWGFGEGGREEASEHEFVWLPAALAFSPSNVTRCT